MKHRFNVGDKIKVVDEIAVAGVRLDEVFEIQSVESVISNDNEPLYNIGLPYLFYGDQLELFESIPFTKSDLEDGMVIEHSNGERKLVMGNIFCGETEWDNPDYYDEELINTTVYELSINKVYKWKGCRLKDIFADNCLELIWERKVEKPTKEMTISEIEEELGYKINIIQEED